MDINKYKCTSDISQADLCFYVHCSSPTAFLVGLIRDNFSDCWLLLIGRAFYAKQIMFEVCNQTSRNVERKFGNAQKRNAEK